MAGVITRQLELEMAKRLFENIDDSANTRYYIGVGKSETWNDSDIAATPSTTEREERNFRAGLQSIKLVTDYSLTIPRNNWISGRVYSAWNDAQVGTPNSPYYVLTEDNQVYICLKQSKNALGVAQVSTVKPTGTSADPLITSDGYVWKFLYTISTASANAFLSSAWMPIKYVDSAGIGDAAVDVEQYAIQNAAVSGQINDITLISGGTGYTTAPTVVITGDGDSAVATASISGGSVVKVEIKDSAGDFFAGNNYTKANLTFTGGGGSGASARPIISPKNGFGADPTRDLRARAVIVDIKPDGSENNEWLVGNSFRQIGLIKNLNLFDSAERYTGTSLNMLYALRLTSSSSGFTVGSTVTGVTSGAAGIIDKLDSDLIYYHQNETTGFGQYIAGEVVEDDATGSSTLNSNADDYVVEPIADPMTGELLYIENRAAVARASNQTEDIKIVLQM